MLDQGLTYKTHEGAVPALGQGLHRKTENLNLTDLEKIISRNDLAGIFQAFLLNCRVNQFSAHTIREYRLKLGQFIRFLSSLGIKEPSAVTPNHIKLFMLKKQETCGATTISNHCRNIRRFFNWLIEENLLDKSPMASIKPPRLPRTVIQPFKPEHICLMLSLCDDSKFLGARNRAIILTFLDTGLRLSELAYIQLKDIDFDRETIKVMGKGAKERIVRISKATQKAILKYLLMRDDGYPCLWVTEERIPITHWGIERAVIKLGKRAGINGVRCSPHTFRHTFATMALKNGAGEFQVQSLLGHSTLTMTRRYAASLNSLEAIEGHKRFSPVGVLGIK